MSFADLKRNRQDISKLAAAAEKLGGGEKNYSDDRIWSPTVDKAGNGYAIIRFLPARAGQDLPWVRYWDHGFKGPTGRWYIENSLTSIGQDDPVSEMNTRLWNSGREEDKEIVRARKRRLHYVSNILVISDPANPENEGKIFLYKFGKKIFDKILDKMQPQFQDEKPVNPYDFWEGSNFRLKIRNVEGYRNYDKSEFDRQGPLFEDDEELERIWKQEHSLAELVAPNQFKSYEDLKKRLNKVLAEDDGYPIRAADQEITIEDETPAPRQKASPPPSYASDDEDDDDSLEFFKDLANR